MSLALLNNVLMSCGAPVWNANNQAIDLIVKTKPVDFDDLRELEKIEIYASNLADPNNPKAQTEYNNNNKGQLPAGSHFKLTLPRTATKCIVAKNLADLLSLDSATYKEPKAYFLVEVENSAGPFIYTGVESLSAATPLIRRYHDAIKLWEILANQAEYAASATHHLFFFGIRKTEVIPAFSCSDLTEDVALDPITKFITDTDRVEARKDIFRSALSDFLQDQNPDRAFSYLLRQTRRFALRLNEAFQIYRSNYSPEKLNQEAQSRYLELAEKLEKVIGGVETKSLSVPAAVLFAVKEVELGASWTTLNVLIMVSTLLYFIAMLAAFLSQKAMLNLLDTTTDKTRADLVSQGLDETNEVLSVSFANLKSRLKHTRIGSRVILTFSAVPLAAVIYAVFFAHPLESAAYNFKVTPTNGIQIIQNQTSQNTGTPSLHGQASTNSPSAMKQ